jgi:drug/metabolite transporter (DMT)-like permease
MISFSYIWTTLISVFLLNEQVSGIQVSGIGFVLFGVFFITKGEKK